MTRTAKRLALYEPWRLQIFIAIAIVAIAQICSCNPLAAKAHTDFVKVPVLFVTDRQPKAPGYGPFRALEKDTVSHIESGTAEVSIPVAEDEHPSDWQRSDRTEHLQAFEKPVITKFPGESAAELIRPFDSALNQLMDRYHKKEFFVFVHGFNNSFDAALTKAAQLSRAAGCPVILYSWPSVGKITKYTVDEGNNEWSQEHYNQFMEHLLDLKKSQDVRITLVAHSLGNRLFVRSGPVVAGTGLFSDLYLVYPDFDAQTFVHYLARYLPPSGPVAGVRCRLLISRRDKALAISERMFGGYTRLGQGTDFCLTALTSPDLFMNIWQIPRRLVQSSQSQTSLSPEFAAKLEAAFKIVDVTAVDSGFIGHKIPYDFIAWMHYRNTPQPGFQLQESQAKGLNRLASHFAHRSKQKVETPLGKVLLVVKSPTKENSDPKN